MRKRIVIRNGKKYIVNTPDDGDCGWEDGIGPGAQAGTLWMKSITDSLWYEVNLVGTSGSFLNPPTIYVNPTPINWVSSDLGYQLLYYSSSVYQTFLSGSGAAVTMSISQTPWPDSSDAKPYLLLRSLTDGYYYPVYANSGSMYLFVNQDGRAWLDGLAPSPTPKPGSLQFGSGSQDLVIPGSSDWAVGTGDFTVEWYQNQVIANNAGTNKNPRIFEIGEYVPNATGISLGASTDTNNLYMFIGNAVSVVLNKPLTAGYLNKWTHIAIARSASLLMAFQDGIKLGVNIASVHDVTDATSEMYIGAESGSLYNATTKFPGKITNFHFVKGTALYGSAASFTPPKTPIIPVANTKLLLLAQTSATVVADSSGLGHVGAQNSVSWSAATPF